MGEKVKKCKKK